MPSSVPAKGMPFHRDDGLLTRNRHAPRKGSVLVAYAPAHSVVKTVAKNRPTGKNRENPARSLVASTGSSHEDTSNEGGTAANPLRWTSSYRSVVRSSFIWRHQRQTGCAPALERPSCPVRGRAAESWPPATSRRVGARIPDARDTGSRDWNGRSTRRTAYLLRSTPDGLPLPLDNRSRLAYGPA